MYHVILEQPAGVYDELCPRVDTSESPASVRDDSELGWSNVEAQVESSIRAFLPRIFQLQWTRLNSNIKTQKENISLQSIKSLQLETKHFYDLI